MTLLSLENNAIRHRMAIQPSCRGDDVSDADAEQA
jgi:hypothetical protein